MNSFVDLIHSQARSRRYLHFGAIVGSNRPQKRYKKLMALGKLFFTRHGKAWDGFAVGLEQKYMQNAGFGEIYILEGQTN